MTKLPYGVNPVIRELPVKYMDKELIVELHPTFIRYRQKGKQKMLAQVDHAIAVAGNKVTGS